MVGIEAAQSPLKVAVRPQSGPPHRVDYIESWGHAAGSALDHANTAIEAMLRGSGLLPIPAEARERAERLRDDS
ncbi:hypothetical protein [Labrys sp. ZIDIC5]|uniref:hypothetical protein n=1 Tax=Labrys sedimenti TaxID=3106036 RepID=UPI002ACB0453|nr:hypothetical protein [Labrys sp. ZIDIC5]MDZ5450861.1 hypothetical protein [Labrys sp. ZIDIC5]